MPVPKLPGLPQGGEENPFDITRIAKERFGVDISPEARAQAESAARTRQAAASGSAAAQQLFAGMAGKPGSADQGIESQRQAIDADTIGAFDAKRKRTIEDVEFGDKQLDRARKHAVENTEFERTGLEYEDEASPGSQLSGMARDAATKLGVKVRPDATYQQIKKVMPWAVDHLRATRPSAGNQWGPQDADYLAQVGQIAQGILPVETQVGTEGVSPKALQLGGQMLGAARGRQNTTDRWRTPRSSVLERFNNLQSSLEQADAIGAGLPGWDTGFAKNRADLAKWYAGLDDPNRAYARSIIGQNLGKAVKAQSGLAVTEFEYNFLQSILPTPEDDENTLFAKLQAFRDFNERELQSHVRNNEQQGGYKFAPGAASVSTPNVEPSGGPSGATAGSMRFEVPGKGMATVPADKAAAFQAKYPNAKRVK